MSKQRAKGTAFESAVCRFLAEEGFPHAERRALSGTQDRGDIAGILGWVLEVKNCRKVELAAWIDEAAVEQANDGADFSAVWHHRVGKAHPSAGYVTMTGAMFVRLLRQAGYGEPLRATESVQGAVEVLADTKAAQNGSQGAVGADLVATEAAR